MRIGIDDPRLLDVRQLLDRHLAFALASSPREHAHALGIDRLLQPDITFYTARDADGDLLGIGALRELDAEHGEVKSMHTVEHARRAGVGGAVLQRITDEARHRGYRRLSLETGTGAVFAPAQSLYARAGFTVCEPFGEYTRNVHSLCMTLALR